LYFVLPVLYSDDRMSSKKNWIKSSETVAPLPLSPFRNDVLAGKVVLITGGATGIGYAIAETFGKHGCKVAIMSRRKKVIMDAVQKLRNRGIDAFGTTVDVRDSQRCVNSVNEVAAHFGRVDYLVNNAAGNFMTPSESLTPNGLATVLGIDLQGCFHMSKACLPHLKKVGPTTGAVIINITAFLQDMCTPFQLHAASAKAGIDVMTNTLGVEWAEYGIRTVGLAPGGIAGTVGGPGGRVFGNNENKASTTAVGGANDDKMDFGEPKPSKVRRQGVPAGRWGRVEDVSLAALYMCTDAASWITATRLTIDGGSAHKVNGFVEAKNMIKRKSDMERAKFKGGVAKL
jgi:2,4-dienoyl-CoA reductase [(3E)-enoyl-CoA-producing], peroxisomal